MVKKILKFKKIILLFIVLITVSLAYFIKDLKIDADFLNYLPNYDKEAKLFKQIGEKFGGTYTGVIAIKSDNIFTYTTLNLIKEITDTLNEINGISSVISITNVIDIKDEGGFVSIDKLFSEEIPTAQNEIDSLKDYILSKNLYNGILVSNDAKMGIIVVKFKDDFKEALDTSLSIDSLKRYYAYYYPSPIYKTTFSNDTAYIQIDKMKIVSEIKQKVNNIKKNDEKILYGGLPFMTKDVGDIIIHDITVLGPIAFVVILFILLFGFKKINDAILPLINVSVAIVWTLGIMSILGYKLTMVSGTIPVVLLAVGSAYSIHVINHINNAKGKDFKEKIKNSLSQVAIPVFFASITTVIGFISFIFGSYLTMISEFGIFSALGIFFSFILSIIFTPILKSFQKKNYTNTNDKKDILFSSFLSKVTHLVTEMPLLTLSFWGIIIILFSLGISKIERNVDLLTYFRKNNPSRISELEIRKKFGGTVPIYVFVKSNDILTPTTLKQMEDIKKFMNDIPYINNTQSVADMIKEINKIIEGNKKIPDSKDKIDNLWFMLEGQEILEQYITSDHTEAIVQGVVSSSDTKIMHEILNKINSYLKKKKYTNMKVTGFPAIYTRLDESLIESQKKTLIFTIIVVFLMVAFMLKSLKQGFYAIIPILTTLIVLFGSMGMLSIPLDVATVLAGSVSIGIGIDYAIHFSKSLSEKRKTLKVNDAIEKTMQTTGKSIIINMLSVMLGFITLIFANLIPLEFFGILIAITMITSALATITILPIVNILKNK